MLAVILVRNGLRGAIGLEHRHYPNTNSVFARRNATISIIS
jgi:hypothetical protein